MLHFAYKIPLNFPTGVASLAPVGVSSYIPALSNSFFFPGRTHYRGIL